MSLHVQSCIAQCILHEGIIIEQQIVGTVCVLGWCWHWLVYKHPDFRQAKHVKLKAHFLLFVDVRQQHFTRRVIYMYVYTLYMYIHVYMGTTSTCIYIHVHVHI